MTEASPSPSDSDSDIAYAAVRFVQLRNEAGFPFFGSPPHDAYTSIQEETVLTCGESLHGGPRRDLLSLSHIPQSPSSPAIPTWSLRLSPFLPQILAVAQRTPSRIDTFQRAFEEATRRLDINAHITGISETPDGVRLSIDTLDNLRVLWAHRHVIERHMGWQLHPLPPPLLWIRLFNVPRPTDDTTILREMFRPHHRWLFKQRHHQDEIVIRKITGRRAFLQCPPEIRAALHKETELTICGRWIRTTDYLPIQVCALCSSLRHNTANCDSKEYLCGNCAETSHPTSRCRANPTDFLCPNCQTGSHPSNFIKHRATDRHRCPMLAKHRPTSPTAKPNFALRSIEP